MASVNPKEGCCLLGGRVCLHDFCLGGWVFCFIYSALASASPCVEENKETNSGGGGGITNRAEPQRDRLGEAGAVPGALPRAPARRGEPSTAPAPRRSRPDFARFLSFFPAFFFPPPSIFSSIPPSLPSLPPSPAWLDQSFGISCRRRLPRAAVRPRPAVPRFPCCGRRGSAGPTRVRATPSHACPGSGDAGGAAAAAGRGVLKAAPRGGLGRPDQVRRAGLPPSPARGWAVSEPFTPKQATSPRPPYPKSHPPKNTL